MNATMPLKVRHLQPSDHQRWDEYVSGHHTGSPFHLTAWKRCMEETFGYQPLYLLASQGEHIRGLVPLFLVSNLVVGQVLISSPFAVYGGILADNDSVRDAIASHVRGLAEQLNVQYVELRNTCEGQTCGYARVDRYAGFACELPRQQDEILLSLPKKTRNMVRKALKYNFSVRRRVRRLDHFEEIYAKTMRRHGTPTFPMRYFRALLKYFGPVVDISEFWLEGKVVAASLNFHFRDRMHVYYAGSDPRYLSYAPNNFMYYDHLCWATENGHKIFDFGRSKVGTGAFEFKRSWGIEPNPLPYEIQLVRRETLPNYSPANPTFRLAIDVWRKLPLPVTRMMGPALVRLFP